MQALSARLKVSLKVLPRRRFLPAQRRVRFPRLFWRLWRSESGNWTPKMEHATSPPRFSSSSCCRQRRRCRSQEKAVAFNSGISLQFSGLPRLGIWTAIRLFKPTHSPKVDGPSDGGMEEENSLERASFGTHSKSASFRLVAAYIHTYTCHYCADIYITVWVFVYFTLLHWQMNILVWPSDPLSLAMIMMDHTWIDFKGPDERDRHLLRDQAINVLSPRST